MYIYIYVCVCVCMCACAHVCMYVDRARRQVFAYLYYDAVRSPWNLRLWNAVRSRNIQGCVGMCMTEGRVWHFTCNDSSCRETEQNICSSYVSCGGGFETDGRFPNGVGIRMSDCRMYEVSHKKEINLRVYQYWVIGIVYVCS